MTADSLEISVKGKWIKVPAVKIDGYTLIVNGRWIRMASIHDEEWIEGELDNPEALIKGLKDKRSNGLRADIFTFAQKLPAIDPKYLYAMEFDSIAAIHIKNFKDWWESLPQETRKNVRRATKRGVAVTLSAFDDKLLQDIVKLNNETPIRQQKLFWHFGKGIEEVRKDYLSFNDRSEYFCAYNAKDIIGMMKIVYCGQIASVLQLLTKTSEFDKRPANILIAKAVERCEEKQVSHLIYGKYHYGNKEKSSLLEFKARNGFKEIFIPRYYIPLTKRGKFGMVLNIHRGVIGILPDSIVSCGVHVREKWYKLKDLACRCSSMLERPNCIR